MTRSTVSRLLAVLFLAATIASGGLAAPTSSSGSSSLSSTKTQPPTPHSGSQDYNRQLLEAEDSNIDLGENQGSVDLSLRLMGLKANNDFLRGMKTNASTMTSEQRLRYIRSAEEKLRTMKENAEAASKESKLLEPTAGQVIQKCNDLLARLTERS
ncbi:hypothetical protein C8R42DRAFT_724946 [Lentinula raphanica]|nr:hypothetical protein C8R42DRAFT_724946 [Lentinula raphanica]